MKLAAGIQPFEVWALLDADESGVFVFPGLFSVDNAQTVLIVCFSVVSRLLTAFSRSSCTDPSEPTREL